uniref:Soluble scavenger receptor cysteine-rich domain-containing protein SSC5D n=1 Tax=Dromaius novaehollandiae TaxID=8790 RepID=A0A8C4KKA0_DRONO
MQKALDVAGDTGQCRGHCEGALHPLRAPDHCSGGWAWGRAWGTFTVRLAGGPSRCAGRVEVRHEGRWGTVCDDDWELPDAAVVCRELGCGTALSAPTGAWFGEGSGPIWLNGLRCRGTEERLELCRHRGWRKHVCAHEEDASAVCSGGQHREGTRHHPSCCWPQPGGHKLGSPPRTHHLSPQLTPSSPSALQSPPCPRRHVAATCQPLPSPLRASSLRRRVSWAPTLPHGAHILQQKWVQVVPCRAQVLQPN